MDKSLSIVKDYLENLYTKYNKKEYVSPDPLEFLYDYPCLKDREIVGLIASSLAYGRVNLILKNVGFILDLIHPPYEFLSKNDINSIETHLRMFKHRFNDGYDILNLLRGIQNVLNVHGSLEECLSYHYKRENNLLKALYFFVNELIITKRCFLLPNPLQGGACKRLMLYLRWMIRKDEVDCGGWKFISPKELIIPLDTHMFKISKLLGLTNRNTADYKTAVEITEKFKLISPDDPVKYDFVLTRFGIRDDLNLQELSKICREIHSVINSSYEYDCR